MVVSKDKCLVDEITNHSIFPYFISCSLNFSVIHKYVYFFFYSLGLTPAHLPILSTLYREDSMFEAYKAIVRTDTTLLTNPHRVLAYVDDKEKPIYEPPFEEVSHRHYRYKNTYFLCLKKFVKF